MLAEGSVCQCVPVCENEGLAEGSGACPCVCVCAWIRGVQYVCGWWWGEGGGSLAALIWYSFSL